MIPKRFRVAGVVFSLVALVSCRQIAEIVAETPTGFAALAAVAQYAAMSPEGMIYRVRVMANEPKQTLRFWSEALTHHLRQEGYVALSIDNAFEAAGMTGSFSEWTVPYAGGTYKYLTGVLVGETTLAVVEASSDHETYDRHRAAVLESLKSVDIRGVEARGFAAEQVSARPPAQAAVAQKDEPAPPRGGCFPAGTGLLTRDGLVPIEAAWPGTRIPAYDPSSGQWREQEVLRAIELPYEGDLITLEIGGQTVEITGNHPVLVASGRRLGRRPLPDELPAVESLSPLVGRWVEARHLRRGDLLPSLERPHARVASIRRRTGIAQVYHLAVSGPHTFAVAPAGIVVHNAGGKETYKAPLESRQAVRERELIGPGAITASLPTDAQSERIRVYSGACTLVIDRVEEAKRRIAGLAEAAGGYVEQSTDKRIVIRVPAGAFRRVFDAVLALGEVGYKAIETYDVTDQFTDPAGRLAVAIKARDRLYVLLTRVEDPKERLEILKKIREYTETIERLELSLKVLEQRIAMSRITVELHPRLAETAGVDRPIPFAWIGRLHPLYSSTAALGGKARLTLPEDVAVFSSKESFRAEAADGTRIRIGTVRNDPRGDSLFWQRALLYHLESKYRQAEPLTAGPLAMALFTSKDRSPYHYLVGALPLEDKPGDTPTLVVFEAYFPDASALERHRVNLLAAFGKVELQ